MLAADNSVFFPAVGDDMDVSATPSANGVHLSAILRSPSSPELLRYRVSLPAGTVLKARAAGAAVLRGGRTVLTISAPAAIDAQGTPLPVRMSVVGDSLFVSVRHRALGVAYPILVDPEIQVSFSDPNWVWDPGQGSNFDGPSTGTIVAPSTTYSNFNAAMWVWSTTSNPYDTSDYMTSVEFGDVSLSMTSQDADFATVLTTNWGAYPCGEYYGDSPPSDVVLSGANCNGTVNIWLSTGGVPETGGATLQVGSLLVTGPYVSGAPPAASFGYGGRNPADPNWHSCSAGVDPVDCATGDLYNSHTDLALHGRGMPFALTRTYNSQAAAAQSAPGSYGYGWSSSFSDHLIIDTSAQSITVAQANGSEVPFNVFGSTISPAGPWIQATLTQNGDGTYTYVLPNQDTELFDSSGRLLTETDRYGNSLTTSYDLSGNLTSVSDGAGRSITLAYNPAGEVSKVTGPMGSVSYGYDSTGNLVQVTDLDGGIWRFGYDGGHQMTSLTDPLGHTTTTAYDSSNRVVSQTDGLGHTWRWSYPSSSETIITSPAGNVTDEQFQDLLPVSITHGYGTSSASTETLSYDDGLNLSGVSDGNGNFSSYDYDPAGDLISASNGVGDVTSWTYDSAHDVTSMTDPMGYTTNYTYQNAELTSISRTMTETGQSQTTSYGYDANGDLTSVTDPLGNTWTYGYDQAGDRTSATAPGAEKTTWTYDGSGYMTSTVSPAGNAPGADPSQYTTTYTNDTFGRAVDIKDPLGHETKTSWDADGNKTSFTDPDGNTTTYSYNADNELTAVARADGTNLSYSYDDDGNLASETDGAGHTTTYGYDPRDERISVTDPLNRTTTYGYDGDGNLAAVTDPAGNTTSYGYDRANELTSISYSDGQTPDMNYSYNHDSQVTSATDSNNSTTNYAYDSLGRLTSESYPNGQQVAYGYDLDNNATQITYPNGKIVARTFDSNGRLTAVTDWLGGTTTFGYDPDSNLVTMVFPSATADQDAYNYDHADQLTGSQMAQRSTSLATISYTRDPVGLVTSETQAGLPGANTTNYSYTPLEQLAAAGTNSYSYDQAGNPTELDGNNGYTYDAANELTSSPGSHLRLRPERKTNERYPERR